VQLARNRPLNKAIVETFIVEKYITYLPRVIMLEK